MSTTHSTTARDAATNAVVDLLDGAGSKLVFRLTGGSVGAPSTAVATLTMATPAFGASSAVVAGRADAGAIASDTNATGNAGAVATATLQTSADTIHLHFAVAASGSDIDMSNGLTVAAGDTVACSSLTYTALPS